MNIGIILFDDAEELDFVGPWEVLTSANKLFEWRKQPAPDAIFTVSETGATVRCAKGMRVEADHSFADCPDLDIILVPGGQGTRREINNPAMLDFVRRQSAQCTWITSVCTGSLVLVAAGPARGKRVTTHWGAFGELAAVDGVGKMVTDQRYVRDGNVITSAGVSAGIDMALWLTGERFGVEHGRMVQKVIQYAPEPPFEVA